MTQLTVEYRLRSASTLGGPLRRVRNLDVDKLTPEQQAIIKDWRDVFNEYLAAPDTTGRLGDPPGYLALMTFNMAMPVLDGASNSIIEHGLSVKWALIDHELTTDAETVEAIRIMTEGFKADTAPLYAEYDKEMKRLQDLRDRGWRIESGWGLTSVRLIVLREDTVALIESFKERHKTEIRDIDVAYAQGSSMYYSTNRFMLVTYGILEPKVNWPDFEKGGLVVRNMSLINPPDAGPELQEYIHQRVVQTIESWVMVLAGWPAYLEAQQAARAMWEERQRLFELEEDDRYTQEAKLEHEERLTRPLVAEGWRIEGCLRAHVIATSGLKPESRYVCKVRRIRTQGSNPSPDLDISLGSELAPDHTILDLTSECLFAVSASFTNAKHKKVTYYAVVLLHTDGRLELVPETTFSANKWPTKAKPAVNSLLAQIVDVL